jgi:hypothetical protein
VPLLNVPADGEETNDFERFKDLECCSIGDADLGLINCGAGRLCRSDGVFGENHAAVNGFVVGSTELGDTDKPTMDAEGDLENLKSDTWDENDLIPVARDDAERGLCKAGEPGDAQE